MLSYSPLAVRPALIGFALALVVVALFLLFPEEAGQPRFPNLPPGLFPIYTDAVDQPFVIPSFIEMKKTPLTQDALPGSSIPFEITLKNTSENDLQNLTLEERFDSKFLEVLPLPWGVLSENLIAWTIPQIKAGEEQTMRYEFRVKEGIGPAPIQTTAYVFGDDLQEMTSFSRMASSTISVIALPISGVEMGTILRFISSLF